MVFNVLKMVACGALMIQSYLVTEDDNKKLNANKDVFEWLVTALDGAICEGRWRGFAAISVVKV